MSIERKRLGTTTTSSYRLWARALPNFRNQMHMRKTENSGRILFLQHALKKKKRTTSVFVIGLRLLELKC